MVVATPDDPHYEMTMDTLDLDLRVLCEKPMALNAQHAREIFEKAEAKRIKHMVLFTWRWQPHFRFLKKLVDDGYVGECFYADLYMLLGFGLEPVYRWRADGQRTNGVISDLGAHLIDFARWYVGKIARVNALLGTFVKIPGLDDRPIYPTNDTAAVLLQFQNSAQGVIRTSSVAIGAKEGARRASNSAVKPARWRQNRSTTGRRQAPEFRGSGAAKRASVKLKSRVRILKIRQKKGCLNHITRSPSGPGCLSTLFLRTDQSNPIFTRAAGSRGDRFDHGLQQNRDLGRRVIVI